MLSFFDAHNHLHDRDLEPHRTRIFADLAAAGIHHAVVNGSAEGDWPDVASLAASHALVRPSFGLHPWDVGNRGPAWEEHLLAQLDAHPRAGVGEIGLDRWMLDRARPDDPRLAGLRRAPLDEQSGVFLRQLAFAVERGRPASIHCLDAFGLLYELLRSSKRPAQGFLLHAYSGPVQMVTGFANLGAYFSFNGGFLDPRKQRLREVYAAVPADRLLVETDAPAMRLPPEHEKFPPLPVAGGDLANHPANLVVSYAALAEWRGVTLAALTEQVGENFRRLFGDSPG